MGGLLSWVMVFSAPPSLLFTKERQESKSTAITTHEYSIKHPFGTFLKMKKNKQKQTTQLKISAAIQVLLK